jgi:hypothetical protein
MKTTTEISRADAIEWVRAHDDSDQLDDCELDEACRALGYDPEYLAGDEDDPTDRRWDVVCAECADLT